MQAEDRIRLQHMIDAAQAALQFVSGRQRVDLDADQMLLFAVVRAIEIVGEAATRMSIEARDAAPGVPWAAIVGMRHRIVHAYFSIDRDIVWNTVMLELPQLLPILQAALARK
ncbi:MAG: hypothetical protein A3E25_16535 [Burkholderiales bacterium RIFCSPHIGHO2_12_FULL_69_20]|nr:MAG: hypothetical protein A3E25_16535 [Burkholderiales bacterium RIFCSPHIGHO2_12_FULL_69_20]